MAEEQKETKRHRIKKWCNDHLVEILMSGLFVGGAVVGIILGKDYGYSKGLTEHRVDHIDISKGLIDRCGEEGAFQALNYVRKDEGNYKKLMDDPDSALGEVAKAYFASDFVSKLINNYNAELKHYIK